MPKIIVPISDLDQSVTRPIITQVVHQLKRETRFPDDTMIWYPGPDGMTYQPRSLMGDDKDFVEQEGSQQVNRIGGNNMVTIEVTEEPMTDYTLTSATYKAENLFIFKDPGLGIFMKPAYSKTQVTIQIHFRAQSATQAANWRNLMRQRISAQADVRIYDLTYSFYVAPTFLTILGELYRLREKVAGYGDTFDDYLKAHLVSKATQLSDLAGKQENLRWTIPETQIRVPGYWDFDSFPETGQRDEKAGTWTSTIAFKFQYDRPQTQVMVYPIMVHNQLLGKKWRPDRRDWEAFHSNPGYSLTARALKGFEGNLSHVPNATTEGYRIPWFDEFIPVQITKNTRNVITALLSIDPANPQALFNLNDMGSFVLDPDVKAFMITEAPYMTKTDQSVFSLVLYQGEHLMTDVALTVDSQLNVSTSFNLDLRQVYHIRFALHYDLTGINLNAQTRFQRNCAAAVKIIDALDRRIKLRPGLPMCSAADTMNTQDFLSMNAILNRRGPINATLTALVSTLFVDMDRKANYQGEVDAARQAQRDELMLYLSSRSTYPNPELYNANRPDYDPDPWESTGESSGEDFSSTAESTHEPSGEWWKVHPDCESS